MPSPLQSAAAGSRIDCRRLVSRADLLSDRPPAAPVEGHPIGNGRMGTLVWTTPGTVEFQVNRVDVFAVNRKTAGARFPGPTDYGGECARVSVGVGGDPFRDGPAFAQRLSLHEARATVSGENVRAECWVAAEDDVLVVTLTDGRESSSPIDVTLAVWRAPEVRHDSHVASYAFREGAGGVDVVQTFRESEHYCSSAVAVRAPGPSTQVTAADERSRTLRLPAARGTRTILIASAASWDECTDAASAAERVLDAVSTPAALEALEKRHTQWWHAFWQRTYVEIGSPDGSGERAANDRTLFLYHMAATSRGAYPPKWNGSIFLTNGDARDWGSQFWLWTTEMLYWPLHAAYASDLADPFFDMYCRRFPALETAARQRWNAAGIFVPETMPFDGPTTLPEEVATEYREIFLDGKSSAAMSPELTARCRFDQHLATLLYTGAETGCDSGVYSWISHLASSAAELAVHAWWRYRYSGDIAWLRSHAYPLLRGVAEFYRSYARKSQDGRWHVHGTNAHEDFWGVTDGIMDLAAIRGTVPLAIRAAELLGVDPDLREQWAAFLDRLAPYPLGADPRAKALSGGTLADDAWAAGYKGAIDGSHNPEDVQLTPIFPFEDWTLETSDEAVGVVARRTLELAPRHSRVLAGESLNTAIRSPIAAVRAGAGEELPAILACYRAAFAPIENGFSLFEQTTPGYQAQSIEHLGLLTMILQEALLQSVAPRPGEPEVIRVFPAWPHDWDAEFRLLARGGFLVSATMCRGHIEAVEIESRRGEECRLRNPWARPCRVETRNGSPCERLAAANGLVRFPTSGGGVYCIVPEERTGKPSSSRDGHPSDPSRSS